MNNSTALSELGVSRWISAQESLEVTLLVPKSDIDASPSTSPFNKQKLRSEPTDSAGGSAAPSPELPVESHEALQQQQLVSGLEAEAMQSQRLREELNGSEEQARDAVFSS